MLFDKPRINDSTRTKEYRLVGGSISSNVDIYLPSNISGSNNIFALRSDIDNISGSGLFISKSPSTSASNFIQASTNIVPLTIQANPSQTENLVNFKSSLESSVTTINVSGFIGRNKSPNCMIDMYANMDEEPAFWRITGSYGSSANVVQFAPDWASKDIYGGGGAPQIQLRRSRGTKETPQAVKFSHSIDGAVNDVLGTFSALGYSTSDWSQQERAAIQIQTASSGSAWGSWTDTNQGATMTLWTTSFGTTSMLPRLRIDDLGNVIPLSVSSIGHNNTSNAHPFIYIKGCSGTPTGIVTRNWAFKGAYPLQIDVTNEKLYFFNAGSWRSLTGTSSSSSGASISGAYLPLSGGTLSGTIAVSGNNSFITTTRGSGIHNEAFGANSQMSVTTGNENTSIGYNSLKNDTIGYSNCAVGSYSLYSNISGNKNVAIGAFAQYDNVSGTDNIAIGNESLYTNNSGSSNIGIGTQALEGLSNGSYNIALGDNALNNNSTGSNNVSIGRNSAFNEMGSNKLYIDSTSSTAGTSATALIYGDFITGELYNQGKRIATSTDLSNYLPLSGGTLSGTLITNGGTSNPIPFKPNITISSAGSDAISNVKNIEMQTNISNTGNNEQMYSTVNNMKSSIYIETTGAGNINTVDNPMHLANYRTGGMTLVGNISGNQAISFHSEGITIDSGAYIADYMGVNTGRAYVSNGGHLGASYGIFIPSNEFYSGTIDKEYGVYQEQAGVDNYLAGNLIVDGNLIVNGATSSNWKTRFEYDFEDLQTTTGVLVHPPLTQTIFLSATVTTVAVSSAKHYGVKHCVSSSSNGSGVWYATAANTIWWDSSTAYKAVAKFRFQAVSSSNYFVLSFRDVTTGSATTNYTLFKMTSSATDAVTVGCVKDSLGTFNYNMGGVAAETNVWYRIEMETVSTTGVKFTLYKDDTNTLVGTETYAEAAYLPTNRNMGLVFYSYNGSGVTSNLGDMDYLAFYSK
jgi:hypothetical protein